ADPTCAFCSGKRPARESFPLPADCNPSGFCRRHACRYSSEMENAIDSFIRFLAVERGLAENYQLSTQRSLSEFAHWFAVKKQIDTKVSHGLRDRAMIELLYASGLRISELANARLENFNFEERMVRVTGKGNKTRIVPVGRKACEALAAYLSTERPKLVKRRSSSEIFLSERGTKL